MNLMKLDWNVKGIMLMGIGVMIPLITVVSTLNAGLDWDSLLQMISMGSIVFAIGYFVYNYTKKH